MAAAIVTFSSNMSALADLNKFEAATRGEFGIGSAAQFGSADLRYISLFVVKTLCLFLLKLSVCCYAEKQYMWMKISGDFTCFYIFFLDYDFRASENLSRSFKLKL